MNNFYIYQKESEFYIKKLLITFYLLNDTTARIVCRQNILGNYRIKSRDCTVSEPSGVPFQNLVVYRFRTYRTKKGNFLRNRRTFTDSNYDGLHSHCHG